MVVLGQWPYQHTITLDQLRRQSGVGGYYLVDEDMIISKARALDKERTGFILDNTYLTVMSVELQRYVDAFSNQQFPPPIYPSLVPIIEKNTNLGLSRMVDDVKDSALVLVVNDQESDIMEDIGALWNNMLGIWIVDSVALRTLREKRRQKTDGRIHIKQNKGGILVEVTGDTTPHARLLKNVGGRYDEDNDIWYVPVNVIHRIMHIAQ